MPYIDCDSHITPIDAWDDIEPEFRDQRPRLVTEDDGRTRWAYPARQQSIPPYSRQIPNPFTPRHQETSKNDPVRRIEDLKKAHMDMQVLVPGNGFFYYDVEPRLAAAVCRGHNNTIGRMVREHPGYFIGLGTMPLQDPAAAVQELERCVKELGLGAPVVYTSLAEDKDLDAEELWGFYRKAEELNVPIYVHPVNTGPIAGGWRLTRHYATRGYGFWSAIGNAVENSYALANLMFGGVLDAFPTLRFCFMEGGGTQIPHLMDSLEAVWTAEGDYDHLKNRPKLRPVEYLDRLYFSVRPTETLLGDLVKRYGHQSWVVGTDYPHADTMGSWPDTVAVVKGRADLSSEAQEAILGGNALRLFGLKVPTAA